MGGGAQRVRVRLTQRSRSAAAGAKGVVCWQSLSQQVPPQDGYYAATFVLAPMVAGAATVLVHVAVEEAGTGRVYHTGPDLALPLAVVPAPTLALSA